MNQYLLRLTLVVGMKEKELTSYTFKNMSGNFRLTATANTENIIKIESKIEYLEYNVK